MKTMYQGDSRLFSLSSPKLPSLTVDWVGVWALFSGDNQVLIGTLSRNADATALVVDLKPEDTENVHPGVYTLVVDVRNYLLNFRQEIHEVLKIEKQFLT